MIFAWSCEPNYFVETPRNAFGDGTPVLNVISATDPTASFNTLKDFSAAKQISVLDFGATLTADGIKVSAIFPAPATAGGTGGGMVAARCLGRCFGAVRRFCARLWAACC